MATRAVKVGNIYAGLYRAIQSTGSDGTATFAFPNGFFTVVPVVVATGVSTDGRDVAVSLMGDPTVSAVRVQARTSRSLPTLNLLASLAGFDVFAPVIAKVHLFAMRPS